MDEFKRQQAIIARVLDDFKNGLTVRTNGPVDVRLLAEYLHRHLFETGLTIKHAKKQLGLTDPSLEARFRQQYGLTPKRYVSHLRTSAATKLMQHEDLRLSDIALSVGYENYRTFARLFKRETGISPNAFREQQDMDGSC